MKILHTSDWHLGRTLYGRKRYDEFSAFLLWLVETVRAQRVDVLLIAGDVFDTCTPSNRAQELYYRFLCQVSAAGCRHVVVIAGNHDSPSFLNAPRELLLALNVYVVGAMTELLEDEVIVLRNGERPEAIVCAVPYLRDKDLRMVEPGETIDIKNKKLIAGLSNHYAEACNIARKKRLNFEKDGHSNIPLIAMGHLFTNGGKIIDGDGVRELYVGSLAHVGKDVFPEFIDYLALGHLHVPQSVGGAEHMRYSGSPIPMGYGEAGQNKQVILIEFNDDIKPIIQEISVPCFQQLVRISGSVDEIQEKLKLLKDDGSCAWLEIEYTGSEIITNLQEILEESAAGSAMEILRIKNKQIREHVINSIADNEILDDLNVDDVFLRCLDAALVGDEDRKDLLVAYHEVIQSLQEKDVNAA